MSEGETQKQEYFGSLDSLRGIAALQVVLYHLPAWHSPLYRAEIVRNGGLMVNFFFVLSGFVLCHSYAERIRSRRDFSRFIVLRIGRLYPVHLAFLLLFVGIECVKYVTPGQGPGAAFSENSPGALVENLFLVHALGFSEHSSTFNFPSWSISTEAYTYLIFALTAGLLSKRRFAVASAVLVCVSLGLLLFAKAQIGEFHWWLRCISGFFLGCLTCLTYRALRDLQVPAAWSVAALSTLLLFINLPLHRAGAELILPLSALLILSLTLAPRSPVNTLLSWRPFRWLGEVSYSLYMSHALVLWVARQACRVLKAPEALIDGATTAQLSPPVALVLSIVVVISTLGVAWLTYRLIESPGRSRARKLVSSWQAKSAAAGTPDPRRPEPAS